MKTAILNSVKKYTKIALLLCAPIIMTNCSEDAPNFPEVNPLAEYFEATGFDEELDVLIDGITFEMGFSFIPTVSGQINAVVAKVPDDKTDLRITIWDKDAATVLRTITVEVDANTELTETITPLELEKNKEYFITFNTNDYFYRTRTDLGPVTYPIVVGDISITNYGFHGGLSQTMPTDYYFDNYSGDLSFIFQETAE